MEHTIPHLLETASHQFGDKPYLFEKTDSGWHGYSFSQSRQLAKAFASALHKHGISGAIAIVSEGRPAWVISELGILISRNFSVPLSIKLSAPEIAFRLNHSRSSMVICSRISVDKVIGAFRDIDHPVKVLMLDSDSAAMERLERECQLLRGQSLFEYQEFMAEGTVEIDNPVHLARIEEVEASVEPGDTATVCYTSGTTGNPKGIMLSHYNYYCNCRDSLAGFPIPFGLRMFVILPIDHSFAHTIALYAALMRQFSLYFVDARGGAMGILRNIPLNMKEVQPDLILSVPALTGNFQQKILAGIKEKGRVVGAIFRAGLNARIYANGNVYRRPAWIKRCWAWFPWIIAEVLVFRKVRASLGNLGFAIGGGASLDIGQQEFFQAIGIPVYQGYGLSENSPVVSTNSFVPGRHKMGTSGKVLPNVECRILAEDGTELGPNQKGEICLRGGSVMKGYLYNDEATVATIRDGWLHTGDLGWLDEDGFLVVSGREKALLITGDGEKYSPESIEDAIAGSSEYIQQCMLWCDHQNSVVSLITLREEAVQALLRDKSPTPEELLAIIIDDFKAYTRNPRLKGFFPIQWQPVNFMIVPGVFSEADGTINSTMKMVRHAIMNLHGHLVHAQYEAGSNRPDNPHNREVIKSRYFTEPES